MISETWADSYQSEDDYLGCKAGEIVGDEKEDEKGNEGVEGTVDDFVLNEVEAVGKATLALSPPLQFLKLHNYNKDIPARNELPSCHPF